MSAQGTSTRIGLLGYGYWGPHLLRNFSQLGCEVVVGDPDPESQARLKENRPDITAYNSLDEVLEHGVDAVVICTPARTHHKLAMQALEAGKHVLVEKPITVQSSDARELVALAEDRGLQLMVGHTFIYAPAVRRIREIVASGELGEIRYATSTRVNLGPVRHDVGALWDLAPHDFSILSYVLGERPTTVSGRARSFIHPGIDDVAFLNLEFGSGAVAQLHVSWLNAKKIREMLLVGSKKMLTYNDLDADFKVFLCDKGVDVPSYSASYGEFKLSYRYGEEIPQVLDDTEPLRAEAEQFLRGIATGEVSPSTGRDGADVVAMLESAMRAVETEQTVPIDYLGSRLRR
jgi:predicted dehydrogenase